MIRVCSCNLEKDNFRFDSSVPIVPTSLQCSQLNWIILCYNSKSGNNSFERCFQYSEHKIIATQNTHTREHYHILSFALVRYFGLNGE